jgi:hypothetical protein
MVTGKSGGDLHGFVHGMLPFDRIFVSIARNCQVQALRCDMVQEPDAKVSQGDI